VVWEVADVVAATAPVVVAATAVVVVLLELFVESLLDEAIADVPVDWPESDDETLVEEAADSAAWLTSIPPVRATTPRALSPPATRRARRAGCGRRRRARSPGGVAVAGETGGRGSEG
jgi:hypothetical protein